MNNFLKGELRNLFNRIASGLIWLGTYPAVTGQLLPDGTLDPDPSDGLPSGYIWVRETFSDSGTTSRAAVPAIRGMINSSVANTPVICGYARWGGKLVAIMPNFSEETVNQYGDQLSGLGIPPISPQNQTTPIPTNLLQGGRVLLNTGTPTPGLNVYVEPDPEQNWPGGYLPIASGDLPTSANQFRWAVFYNEGDTPAYVLTTAVVRPNVVSFVTGNSQDAVGAQIPAGAIRYGCVTLAYAQTDLTPATTITRNDLREFFNVEGALLSGDSEAQTISAGAITTGNKSVIIVTPSSGSTDTLSTITLTGSPRELWLIAAAGDTITLATGGNIAVGAVCTDTQAVLIYHNGTTAYVVSGGSGGDATTVTYTPTTPADWPSVPTDVQEALDTLAADAVTGGINKDLFTQTADVTVANTTTPTTLLGAGQGSSLLPANYFVVGRTLVIDLAGTRATALVAPNITFTITLGSTTICLTATFADVGSLSGQQWHLHAEITCRTTGGSGSVSAQGWVELNSTSTVAIRAEMATISLVTLDTTVSQQAKALVTWGTASASNTATATEARLQTVDPNAGAGAGGAIYPQRATCWADESTVLTGNAFTRNTGNTAQPYIEEVVQGSASNGDSLTNGFLLAAGTYVFSVLGVTFNFFGKLDWYVSDNGGSFYSITTGQDWYSASSTPNVVKTASVMIAGDGYHVLKSIVNGKNASSTGFTIDLTKMWFKPSAD